MKAQTQVIKNKITKVLLWPTAFRAFNIVMLSKLHTFTHSQKKKCIKELYQTSCKIYLYTVHTTHAETMRDKGLGGCIMQLVHSATSEGVSHC